jgi:hypothetical protein
MNWIEPANSTRLHADEIEGRKNFVLFLSKQHGHRLWPIQLARCARSHLSLIPSLLFP